MKTIEFTATAEMAYKKPIAPIEYSGKYQAFETIEEVRAVGEYPSDKEVLNFVNANRKASARSKALTEALDAAGHVKPTLEDDVMLQLKTLIKVYMAAKKPYDKARALACSTLGVEWPEDEA